MRNKKWLWPAGVIVVATVFWFTGNRGLAVYGWVMGLIGLGLAIRESRQEAPPAEPVPEDPGTPVLAPAQDPVLVAAAAARVRDSRRAAVVCVLVTVVLTGAAVLPLGSWRALFLGLAVTAAAGAVNAVADSVRFAPQLPGSWTELEVLGPAESRPWRLARTPDGTELAFKLTSTGDVLTRHIELTRRLRTLGDPRVGGPVRIAVPGHPLLGLATFSLP
ncbi:hypothetical protein AB0L41_49785 [Amycolatopsis mediterranei]|uniref:hypothetical protein n=1 Tax=Amycolatopsis mediterranei TaxID=33910 RepID=UPI00342EE947